MLLVLRKDMTIPITMTMAAVMAVTLDTRELIRLEACNFLSLSILAI